MMLGIEQVELLLIVAAIVAVVSKRLRMPYTVGLVVAGLGLGLAPFEHGLTMTKDLVFGALLPPLVFEASLNIKWRALKQDLAFVGVLATLGVAVSCAVVAEGLVLLLGWGQGEAWVFAALISATDPVAVIAAFKEFGGRSRLRLLLESESLINDGTAAVAFALALAIASGSVHVSAAGIAWRFASVAGGGVLAGALVAAAALLLARNTHDHLVELVITTVAAYGSFLLAERFGMSGILATLTAGLLIGNLSPHGVLTPRGSELIEPFWELGAFAANSIVFLLVGVREAQVPFSAYWPAMAAAVLLVLCGRAVSVYGICLGFGRTRWKTPPMQRHALFWGGLRGALALALVLGLPETFPGKSRLTGVAFAVVAFSVIVQGLTMSPLLKRTLTPGLRHTA